MDNLVDFSQCDNIVKHACNLNYKKNYDEHTTVYYRAHRYRKVDPIDLSQLTDTNAFKFPYIWNPYTGELERDETGNPVKDPFGSLYISPCNIVKTIYYKRLLTLWCEPTDDTSGYFSGYYGDSVGIGEKFEIPNRGCYKERYLFRLPVTDCYLDSEHKMTWVTMGPQLTNDDVKEIDRLIKNYWKKDTVVTQIYQKIQTLERMKDIYEVAIAKQPRTFDKKKLTSLGLYIAAHETHDKQNELLNRQAVDILRSMQ